MMKKFNDSSIKKPVTSKKRMLRTSPQMLYSKKIIHLHVSLVVRYNVQKNNREVNNAKIKNRSRHKATI